MKLFGNHNVATPAQTTLIDCEQLEDRFNPVSFKSSVKARYVRISIDADLKIKVVYPNRINVKKAHDFFKSKIVWTQNTLLKLSKRKEIRAKTSEKSAKNLTKIDFLAKNQYLVKRCKELAQQHQFNIGKISLKRQKTIWGSCSSRNDISLNSNLAFLSDELIDYVILHELAHTRVKNHSNKFWNELKIVLPNAKTLDKELKNHSPSFFNQNT
jgi:predicted metal-dependent hydrolase